MASTGGLERVGDWGAGVCFGERGWLGGGKRVPNVGFMLEALGDDTGGEDEVIECKGSGPGAGDCWIYVSGVIIDGGS